MRVVLAYDVSQNRRRARLAALLSQWGDRVQRSVFECTTGPDEFEELVERAVYLIDTGTDAINVYRQCAQCMSGRLVIGQAVEYHETPYWVI